MEVSFSDLETSSLIVDTVYKSGSGPLDEPIHFLFPKCGNMGGFRKVKRNDGSGNLAYVILYTTMNELEWPDFWMLRPVCFDITATTESLAAR